MGGSIDSYLGIADDWWAKDFACSGSELRPTKTHVQQHQGALLEATGIWILVAGGAPLISLPADTVSTLGDRARSWSAADVADVEGLRRHLVAACPRAVDRIIGPAFIGYGVAESLDLADACLARPISSAAQARQLQAACQPEEWEHGGSDPEHEQTFGCVDPGHELRALAGYAVWDGSIAHISIVTHPHCRGHGYGRAAVALAAQHALAAGLLPQYRTLRQNLASVNIAKRLGFIEYGFSVYVRLGPA
ncbi:MAG: GNAT family N-acetyltransferase [Myxococcales bacterium]|nr:MAG: GNAT family N-acetyltransferase [Myxococcales bacterium]